MLASEKGGSQLPRKKTEDIVTTMVHENYWIKGHNCATTTLIVLSKLFNIPLEQQVLYSSRGMHGAGCFRAQCGLVEGTLMFFGILGTEKELGDPTIAGLCYKYAEEFTKKFGSLSCRDLRPEGFNDDDPPHLCEKLSVESILFSEQFITENLI